jgi:hypothetical protein
MLMRNYCSLDSARRGTRTPPDAGCPYKQDGHAQSAQSRSDPCARRRGARSRSWVRKGYRYCCHCCCCCLPVERFAIGLAQARRDVYPC